MQSTWCLALIPVDHVTSNVAQTSESCKDGIPHCLFVFARVKSSNVNSVRKEFVSKFVHGQC